MNTVYIADDNDTDRAILEATLQKFGFTASICKPFRKSELSEMLN